MRIVPRRANVALLVAALALSACTSWGREPCDDEFGGRQVRGVVVDAHGHGHANVRVAVSGARAEVSAVTQKDGSFLLCGRVPSHGTYPLAVTVPAADSDPLLFAHATPGPYGTLHLVADARLRIRGVVEPPPGPGRTVETLLLRGGGTSRQHDTEPDGSFDVAWLSPGIMYSFHVWRAGVGWREVGTARTGEEGVVLGVD